MKLLLGGSAVLVVLLSALGFDSHSVPRLVVRDQASGRVLVCTRLQPGTPITLSFQHSMYGGDVLEEYRAAGLKLRRARITTANAAAAEYYAYLGGVARDGNRFVVEAPVIALDGLNVLVDGVGRQRLSVGGAEYDLLARAGDGVSVRIGVERPTGFNAVRLQGC